MSEALLRATAVRLATQLDALVVLLADITPDALERRPSPGKWSAREHLAHLARYQHVFLQRLSRILAEDAPALDRYHAEDDADWPAWAALPLAEIRACLARDRAALQSRVDALTSAQLGRAALHPVLGRLAVPIWLEFFLLHEAHHLLEVLKVSRERDA